MDKHYLTGLGQGRRMATKKDAQQQLLELRELLERADRAIHRSMPPGGNAHHEEAQTAISDALRKLKEND